MFLQNNILAVLYLLLAGVSVYLAFVTNDVLYTVCYKALALLALISAIKILTNKITGNGKYF